MRLKRMETDQKSTCSATPQQVPRHRSRWLVAIGVPVLVIGMAITPAISPGKIYAGSSGSWITRAPMPTARYGLAAATGSDGRIYTIGGNGACANGWGYCGTVEIYTPGTNAWTIGSSLLFSPSDLAAAVGTDGRIYALGGHGYGNFCGGAVCRDVNAYDPSTSSWTAVSPMSTGRDLLGAAAGSDGRIYAVGGENDSGPGSFYNTVEAYTPSTNTWAATAPMSVARGALAVVAGPDGRIYAIGGYGVSGPVNTVEVFTPSTNSWTTLSPMPTARYALAAAAGSDGQIYAIGGSTLNGRLSTVEVYDPATNMWRTGAPIAGPREQLAASASGGSIYAIGGADNSCSEPSTACNTVQAYDTSKPIDSTPPAITPGIVGTLGGNGWYTGDVTVSWSVFDPESAISSEIGCSATTISSDTAGTTLTCTATSAGGTSSKSVTIKRDATAPTCSVTMNPNNISPPNHKMVAVHATVMVTDTGSGANGFVLTGIISTEGDVSTDVQGFVVGQPSTDGQVRAERSGSGSGRVYTVTYTARDTAGNTSTCAGTVAVPHDKGH